MNLKDIPTEALYSELERRRSAKRKRRKLTRSEVARLGGLSGGRRRWWLSLTPEQRLAFQRKANAGRVAQIRQGRYGPKLPPGFVPPADDTGPVE